ncbi:uncharacterized protein [Solanum tuberosum]|uniref:uncharacterized protein n=1 Tax=Solanum tuberosum TaxID=4113 RepID=UPI00073A2795|nr:PREDICTED: uncharacterized protein LOC107059049 [Solanum tuberosum]
MAAEDIFDITCTRRQSLSLNHVHDMLSNKVFEIQLRKSSWGSSNTKHATLSVLSYIEKTHTPQSTTDRTSKKIKPLEINEVEVTTTISATGSSNPMPKFEPPHQRKAVKGTLSPHFVTFAYNRDTTMNDSPYALVFCMRNISYGEANCSIL